jgi:tetratricopeptide (TPR) repeat protein
VLLRRAADYFAQERKVQPYRRLEDLNAHLAEIELRTRAGEYDLAASQLLQIDATYLLPWGHAQLVKQLHQSLQGNLQDSQLGEASLGTLGTAQLQLGDAEQAANYYQGALSLAIQNGNAVGQSRWLIDLGRAKFELGFTDSAINYYEQARSLAREAGFRAEEAHSEKELCLCYGEIGQLEHAVKCGLKVLSFARDIGDQHLEAEQLVDSGYFCALLDEGERATEYFENGLAITRNTGYRLVEGQCLIDCADNLIDQGDFERAIMLATEAVEIGRHIGSPRLAWDGNGVLALGYLRTGELAEARTAIDEAYLYRYRRRSYAASALKGIIAVRQGDRFTAHDAFARAVGEATAILQRARQNFAAFDAQGLALCGLSLHGDPHLDEAIAAYTAARSLTAAPGVVRRAVSLLDQLARSDSTFSLAPVRQAAMSGNSNTQP